MVSILPFLGRGDNDPFILEIRAIIDRHKILTHRQKETQMKKK